MLGQLPFHDNRFDPDAPEELVWAAVYSSFESTIARQAAPGLDRPKKDAAHFRGWVMRYLWSPCV